MFEEKENFEEITVKIADECGNDRYVTVQDVDKIEKLAGNFANSNLRDEYREKIITEEI